MGSSFPSGVSLQYCRAKLVIKRSWFDFSSWGSAEAEKDQTSTLNNARTFQLYFLLLRFLGRSMVHDHLVDFALNFTYFPYHIFVKWLLHFRFFTTSFGPTSDSSTKLQDFIFLLKKWTFRQRTEGRKSICPLFKCVKYSMYLPQSAIFGPPQLAMSWGWRFISSCPGQLIRNGCLIFNEILPRLRRSFCGSVKSEPLSLHF